MSLGPPPLTHLHPPPPASPASPVPPASPATVGLRSFLLTAGRINGVAAGKTNALSGGGTLSATLNWGKTFSSIPVALTSVSGTSSHWTSRGPGALQYPTKTGAQFRMYYTVGASRARSYQYNVHFIAGTPYLELLAADVKALTQQVSAKSRTATDLQKKVTAASSTAASERTASGRLHPQAAANQVKRVDSDISSLQARRRALKQQIRQIASEGQKRACCPPPAVHSRSRFCRPSWSSSASPYALSPPPAIPATATTAVRGCSAVKRSVDEQVRKLRQDVTSIQEQAKRATDKQKTLTTDVSSLAKELTKVQVQRVTGCAALVVSLLSAFRFRACLVCIPAVGSVPVHGAGPRDPRPRPPRHLNSPRTARRRRSRPSPVLRSSPWRKSRTDTPPVPKCSSARSQNCKPCTRPCRRPPSRSPPRSRRCVVALTIVRGSARLTLEFR